MVRTEAQNRATCPTPLLVNPCCGEMRTRPVHGAFQASFLGCRVGEGGKTEDTSQVVPGVPGYREPGPAEDVRMAARDEGALSRWDSEAS